MHLKISDGGRRYGYLKNPPDHRDFGMLHPEMPFTQPASWPERTSNAGWLGPVRDQGAEGSCTGHALVGCRDFLYNKLKQYEPTQLDAPPDFSPAFAYYMGRKIDGSLDQGDCGSTGRSVAMGARLYGVCQESDDPYVAGAFDTAPTDAQVAAAAQFKSGAFHAVSSVWDVKACLASGYAVMLGFSVYQSFEGKISSDGLMPTPDIANEQLLGGHEVLIFDYDDTRSMGDGSSGGFSIRNSWGDGWGDGGNFYMSYTQFPLVVLDATLQHLGRPWVPPSAISA